MSGEYYCIEEVGESSNYHEEFKPKTSRSGRLEFHDVLNSGDHETQSTSTKKSQDYQLCEIEEQLQIAESRCNSLKNQLDSMKKNYQKISPRDSIQSRRREETHNRNNKVQRKRPVVVQPSTSSGVPTTPYPQIDSHDDGFGLLPLRSNSSSAMRNESSKSKSPPSAPYRQNSNSISTDHSGAAVKTINNILFGIADSANRLTQLHNTPNKDYPLKFAYVEQPFSNDIGASCSISGKPFSPRLKKRLYEQQKKVEELVKESQFVSINDMKVQTSSASIKSKETALEKWSKQITGHLKAKPGAKKDTTIKTKTNAKDDNTQSMFKKRKCFVKRLKSTSKISVAPKPNDSQSRKFTSKYSTDNLVELYHNVAAKSSDSDVSNHVNRLDTKQGAGDVLTNPVLPSYNASKTSECSNFDKSGSRLTQSPKILSPIEENTTIENSLVRRDYFQHMRKNYELPTIASKLKRVTKNYLRSFNYFNFRCIPFCAAKSTSPSHNIGINIQQVMSIIKTKQPMSGISPTLAHNISLAAEKLQGSPLSAFVSNLNTRIGSVNSACPLVKHQINFTRLQEIAKTIPEEPFEEEEQEDGFGLSVSKEACGNKKMEKVREEIEPPPVVPPIWSAGPDSTRCTCISQKGVPFHQVLSKYQIATSEIMPTQLKQDTKVQPIPRQIHTANYKNSKQRTAAWVSNGVKENVSLTSTVIDHSKPPEESQDQNHLRGKEKNLKAVLKNLHDEFDNLNMKYEELSKCSTKSNPHTIKLLEEMELQLNQKEDEINMVMSLYTEVMALKDQVKKMKERPSCETIQTVVNTEKKESNATLHLTHLLRQIQNYQNRFPNK